MAAQPLSQDCMGGLISPSTLALQAMTNDSELHMENNIRKRDTQFISMFWLNTLDNQMKCQSNVFDTVFTNNICSYLLCVVAANMEQCRYNILAQNISKGFQ